MTQTKNYAQVLPKIGVERRGLLTDTKVKALSDSRGLSDFVAQLRDTVYQEQISKISTPFSTRKLERAFNDNLLNTYLMLLKNLPKCVKPYFELYLERFEIEHIKMIVKATIAKMTPEEKLSKIYLPVEDYFSNRALIEDAVKATAVAQIVQAFKKTVYFSSLSMGLKKYEETGSAIQFDLLLDRQYYEKLCTVYEKLPKKEKPHAKFYASMNVDSFLLTTVLRGKALGYDSDWLRVTLPTNYFNLGAKTVDSLLYAIDYNAALKIVESTEYKNYFSTVGAPEETISAAETAFKNAVLQYAKSRVLLDVFNIGAPLSFITLKEADVHNLIALTLSIDAMLKPEEIQNHLLSY
ncbi:MAG: V-type ATPase subunit [Candidatus Bathyarchaeia archaeon]